MADYRPNWDEDLVKLSREFFDKHIADCTAGERKAVFEIRDSRERLARVNKFIGSLR